MFHWMRGQRTSAIITNISLVAYLSVLFTPIYAFSADTVPTTPTNPSVYQSDKINLDGAKAGTKTSQEAMDFYKSLPNMNFDASGKSQFGNGQSVDFNTIYPKDQTSPTLSDISGVYGDDKGTNAIGIKESKTLKTEKSAKGEAYRTMIGASRHTSIDFKKEDPIFKGHNNFIENEQKFVNGLSKCETKYVFDEFTDKKHIPDYKECTKTVDVTGRYIVDHPFSAGLVSHNAGPANIKSCGDNCVDIWLGKVGDDYWYGHCRIFEDFMSVNVINPEAVKKATITRAKWDDYMQIYVGSKDRLEKVWGGPLGKDVFPPETKGRCELSTSWDQKLNVDVTKYFKDAKPNEEIFFKNRVSVTGKGEGFAQLRIEFDKSRAITNDVWTSPNQNEFDKAVKAIKEGYCQDYQVICHDKIVPDENHCTTIDGVKICDPDFAPPPLPQISPFCKRAEVITNCSKDFGVNNTCKNYEKQGCAFIKSSCIVGKEGGESGCWQSSEVWDCGKDVPISNGRSNEQTVCDGEMQCLDGKCLTPATPPNGDFATAAAMLHAATFALGDTSCQDAEAVKNGESSLNTNSCVVFQGEALTCRTAMGGWVDCCDQPVGVSWIEYVKLSMMTMKAADALAAKAGLFESGKGVFDMASDAALQAVDAITKPAISAFNSFIGNAGADVAKKATEQGIVSLANAAINDLTTKVAEWTLKTFGEGVTNAIFQGAASNRAQTASKALTNNTAQQGGQAVVELSSSITTAISVVGYAYMAYQIANMLVHIIWACSEDEFKLAVKKETKLATKVGSWCSKKLLGACIEKTSSYCTYNSQVARIINDYNHNQQGGYGDKKNPNCEGITLGNLKNVDFTKIDFSEWTATLKEADMLPDFNKFDLDKYTGKGSALNANGERLNSVERFEKGLDGVDMEKIREKAKDNLRVTEQQK